MPKPTKGPRLGGSPSHQRIILANLASQVIEHGRITTTETRARRVQPLVETLITKAKRGEKDVHARRLVAKTIRDKSINHVLFAEVAPKMAEREGGYTRITKIGTRKGDNAQMAVIELITTPVEKKADKAKTEAKDKKAGTKSGKAEAKNKKPETKKKATEAGQEEAGKLAAEVVEDDTAKNETEQAEESADAKK